MLPEMPLQRDFYVQNDCVCNQTLAATNRVICEWPQPDRAAIQRLKKVAKRLSHYLGTGHSPVAPEEWTAKYTGMKAARYKRAIQSLETSPLCRKDAYIQAFVKAEKIADPSKDPRMIQARSGRFNVVLGSYLKAIEHSLYNMKGQGTMRKYLPPTRSIMKGLSMPARGALLTQKWRSLKNPVQLALDCSRFDAHCSKSLLEVEHAVYLRCFLNSPELDRILKWQLSNKCFTQGGVVYSCEGRRMSGDMNTALGNCVLMVLMLADAMKEMGITTDRFEIADDGDDCALFVEKEDADRVSEEIVKIFKTYGHDLKIEERIDTFEKVTLCGARVIRVGGKRIAILEPGRTIGKSRVIMKVRQEPDWLRKYVSTVGQCLLALHTGVPVLQSHAQYLMRAHRARLKEVPGSYLYRLDWKTDPMQARSQRITDQAREDFAQAFDVSIVEQLEAEQWYDSHWIGDQLPPVHGGLKNGKYAEQDKEDRRKWSEEGSYDCPS